MPRRKALIKKGMEGKEYGNAYERILEYLEHAV